MFNFNDFSTNVAYINKHMTLIVTVYEQTLSMIKYVMNFRTTKRWNDEMCQLSYFFSIIGYRAVNNIRKKTVTHWLTLPEFRVPVINRAICWVNLINWRLHRRRWLLIFSYREGMDSKASHLLYSNVLSAWIPLVWVSCKGYGWKV